MQPLYFCKTDTGEEIAIPELNLASIMNENNTIDTSNGEQVIKPFQSIEIDLEPVDLKTNLQLWYNLMGLPTANNWRKMHGGVMTRRKNLEKNKKTFYERSNQYGRK